MQDQIRVKLFNFLVQQRKDNCTFEDGGVMLAEGEAGFSPSSIHGAINWGLHVSYHR